MSYGQLQQRSLPQARIGIGICNGHHGEFLQGVFMNRNRRLQRGLLTVPCPLYQSRTTFWPGNDGGIVTRPPSCSKAAKAARLALNAVGLGGLGGDLTIESNIPQGSGFGSSTADVIATIRAVADFAEVTLSRGVVSQIAVKAEIASDSLAFNDQPILFGHRSGEIIETFCGDYPALSIIGFSTGDPAVATDSLRPARYSSREIEEFSVLCALAAKAVQSCDGAALGHVSLASARMNQRHLPISRFIEIERLAQNSGALGIQIAHSGNVAGLLLPSGDPQKTDIAIGLLSVEGFSDIVQFKTSSMVGVCDE